MRMSDTNLFPEFTPEPGILESVKGASGGIFDSVVDTENTGVLDSLGAGKLTNSDWNPDFDPNITQEYDTTHLAAITYALDRLSARTQKSEEKHSPQHEAKGSQRIPFNEMTLELQQGGLNESQMKLLSMYSEVRDEQSFSQSVGLNSQELVVSDHENWIVAARARPLDDQVSEFERREDKLYVADSDYTPSRVKAASAIASRNGAEVTDDGSQFYFDATQDPPTDASVHVVDTGVELRNLLPAVVPPVQESLVGAAGTVTYTNLKPTGSLQLKSIAQLKTKPQVATPRLDWRAFISNPRFIGGAVLAVFWMSLLFAPTMIRASSASGNDPEAARQMRSSVKEQMKDETPYYVQKPADMPRGSSSGTGAGGRSNSSGNSTSTSNSTREGGAKTLSGDGLEAQLAADPGSDSIRIALIKQLIAHKQFGRARELAIIGFQSPSTSPQMKAQFWALFKQCP